uniref:Uncharacterized protein n=1 Tax=Arundo donax TaxID=35708 RepID=A0A0A9GS10_ARUDO
MKISIQLTGY